MMCRRSLFLGVTLSMLLVGSDAGILEMKACPSVNLTATPYSINPVNVTSAADGECSSMSAMLNHPGTGAPLYPLRTSQKWICTGDTLDGTFWADMTGGLKIMGGTGLEPSDNCGVGPESVNDTWMGGCIFNTTEAIKLFKGGECAECAGYSLIGSEPNATKYYIATLDGEVEPPCEWMKVVIEEEESEGTNLTWLWILLGVLGGVGIIAVIVVLMKPKASKESFDEEMTEGLD
eukprot:gnl/TRDRNA2_/TRDRNA2_132620_c0_seq1.p1 gnl/TRDRNA2_/TRDRNA2_132620_c0~~gnl/TRDRNA2_/TRDRNA2_132620_c0_seq1.p1  ORF type:complete len:234 (+),score=29.53 gnl/TRDRNA2_/TRDRNA2_132620_c0_seq1:122-823(+)